MAKRNKTAGKKKSKSKRKSKKASKKNKFKKMRKKVSIKEKKIREDKRREGFIKEKKLSFHTLRKKWEFSNLEKGPQNILYLQTHVFNATRSFWTIWNRQKP